VLKYLSEAGLKLAILSAATTQRVQAFVQRHQLGNYVQVQMGVDEGPSKPDPTIYPCLALGVYPSATLMVGDSLVILRWRVGLGQQVVSASAGTNQRQPIYRQRMAIAQLDEIKFWSRGASAVRRSLTPYPQREDQPR